jgi:GNAT superfamily N-acetyltransferase
MTMTVRALRREDAPAFHAHRLGALQESPEAFGSTYEEDLLLAPDVVADRIDEHTVEPRRVVFAAFEGDALVGFVGCMQEHKLKSRHKAIVWGTYVSPGARKRGIAAALLSRLIANVSEWEHVEQLTLTVVERATAARALYVAAGFEIFGREPDGMRQGGVRETVEHMSLRLPRSQA